MATFRSWKTKDYTSNPMARIRIDISDSNIGISLPHVSNDLNLREGDIFRVVRKDPDGVFFCERISSRASLISANNQQGRSNSTVEYTSSSYLTSNVSPFSIPTPNKVCSYVTLIRLELGSFL